MRTAVTEYVSKETHVQEFSERFEKDGLKLDADNIRTAITNYKIVHGLSDALARTLANFLVKDLAEQIAEDAE